jgi:hypothetical protein
MSGEASFHYERTDVGARGIAWLAAGLAIFVIATPLLMPLVFPQSMQQRTPTAPPALSADAPHLEVAPKQELRSNQRGQTDFVNSYGWSDRSQGVAHIPVKRAMDLVVQRGLEGWSKP